MTKNEFLKLSYKEQRETVVDWLKASQERGDFDGFPEESMNFDYEEDDAIDYYKEEWFLPDLEN